MFQPEEPEEPEYIQITMLTPQAADSEALRFGGLVP